MAELKGRGRPVIIAPDSPTVIIGERINPTGRKRLAASLAEGRLDLVVSEAKKQVEEGADVIDVNVGAAGVDQTAVLPEAVVAVQELVEAPVSIDSADPQAIAAALEAGRREFGAEWRPLVNSVTGEEASLKALLPVVAGHGVPVIGLLTGESGIPKEAADRLAVAEKIAAAAEEAGIAREDLVIDPVVTPIGVDSRAARVTLETVRLVAENLGTSFTMGASNVSFGLPDREVINTGFITTALAWGVNAPIVNPGAPGVVQAIRVGDLIAGRDKNSLRYLRYYRAMKEKG